MNIWHCSDLHGYFPEPSGKFDVVVCSGDIFLHNQMKPNYGPTRRCAEIEFQTNWLKSRIETIRDWLRGKPLIWCSGNHDFINPCKILSNAGIETINLDNKVVEYKGFVWYGFPWVCEIRNEWNWECNPTQLKKETDNFIRRLKGSNALDKLDILVAHNSILNTLDKCEGQHIGNRYMNTTIKYALQKPLGLYLCGHNHGDYGVEYFGETLVSNAASAGKRTGRIISFDNNKWIIV